MRASKVTIKKEPSRKRGRPSLSETTQLDKQAIIAKGLTLARTNALHQITITGIAKDFGVTPALIHYLIPGKDGLISGVMNAYYKKVCSRWPKNTDNWRQHLESVALHVYKMQSTYRGVVLYTSTHNRYRIVQNVSQGETDYGLKYLDLLIQSAMTMGLDPHNTMILCENFVDLITGAARQAIDTRLPRQHETYLRSIISNLNMQKYPGIDFVGDELYSTDPDSLFESSLRMLLDAFEIRRADLLA